MRSAPLLLLIVLLVSPLSAAVGPLAGPACVDPPSQEEAVSHNALSASAAVQGGACAFASPDAASASAPATACATARLAATTDSAALCTPAAGQADAGVSSGSPVVEVGASTPLQACLANDESEACSDPVSTFTDVVSQLPLATQLLLACLNAQLGHSRSYDCFGRVTDAFFNPPQGGVIVLTWKGGQWTKQASVGWDCVDSSQTASRYLVHCSPSAGKSFRCKNFQVYGDVSRSHHSARPEAVATTKCSGITVSCYTDGGSCTDHVWTGSLDPDLFCQLTIGLPGEIDQATAVCYNDP